MILKRFKTRGYEEWPVWWKLVYGLTEVYWKFADYGDKGFMWRTPLFSFRWANGLEAMELDAREWGWRIYYWPRNWWVVERGGYLYRKSWNRGYVKFNER